MPTSAHADLCHLPAGPRTAGQVFFTVIGGLPHGLVAEGTELKSSLTSNDWKSLIGNDPLRYDLSGADPHMIPSIAPRPGLPGPRERDDADPVHGREVATNGMDLQYACSFALAAPIDCTGQSPDACACAIERNLPICGKGSDATKMLRAAAYPAVRELEVAKGLGDQAVVSSICPAHFTETAPGDPLYAYRPAMRALVRKLATSLKR